MIDVPITATVTAYDRIDRALVTIQKILDCRPAPDELLVHVDAGKEGCAGAIRERFPSVPVIVSTDNIGPGGGRNKLMAAAHNDLVANFDDDSFPFDSDFFARAVELFTLFPQASLIGATVFHPHEDVPSARRTIAASASFCGGGVVFRRSDFVGAGGYLPLPIAYGAEEEDMSLRLFERGKCLLYSPWLRVFHDSSLAHHADSLINAHALANVGLVVVLRYPARYWPIGAAQVLSRLMWCVRHGRWKGLGQGLVLLCTQAWRFRSQRAPVGVAAFAAKRRARHASAEAF